MNNSISFCLIFLYFSALETLVNYAYSGRVAMDIHNVQSILVGANFLQLQDIKEACCDFLKDRYGKYFILIKRFCLAPLWSVFASL